MIGLIQQEMLAILERKKMKKQIVTKIHNCKCPHLQKYTYILTTVKFSK